MIKPEIGRSSKSLRRRLELLPISDFVHNICSVSPAVDGRHTARSKLVARRNARQLLERRAVAGVLAETGAVGAHSAHGVGRVRRPLRLRRDSLCVCTALEQLAGTSATLSGLRSHRPKPTTPCFPSSPPRAATDHGDGDGAGAVAATVRRRRGQGTRGRGEGRGAGPPPRGRPPRVPSPGGAPVGEATGDLPNRFWLLRIQEGQDAFTNRHGRS